MFTDIFPKIASHTFSDLISIGSDDAVYLTFDDGPDPNVTQRIIALLDKLSVKATFFLSGVNVEKYPELLQLVAQSGHTIGSHGYYHKPLTFASAGYVRNELLRVNDLIDGSLRLDSRFHGNDDGINKYRNVNGKLFRPPYGRIGWGVMRAVRQLGMTVVLWSYSPLDYRSLTASEIADRVIRYVKPGDIVLLHERERTLKALEPMILGLQERGLTLRGL